MDARTLRSANLEVEIIGFGARVARVRTRDAAGTWGDVALGFETASDYEADRDFFGATIGRFSNRIAGGTFELDGQRFEVPCNEPKAALHGGPDAFDRQLWGVGPLGSDEAGQYVTLTRHSPDGENGFPGNVDVSVTYRVVGSDLLMHFQATTDAATVVGLTNHTYWNLSARGGTIEDHLLTLYAPHYLPVDADLVPTGELASVNDSPFDFRTPVALGARVREADSQLRLARGYDHCFVLDLDKPGLRPAAFVLEPVSGRTMEVSTDQPGLQVYSGNFLDGSKVLRGSRVARQGDAFCLEPQALPDAPNHPAFPSAVLLPGETYERHVRYRFGVVTPSS